MRIWNPISSRKRNLRRTRSRLGQQARRIRFALTLMQGTDWDHQRSLWNSRLFIDLAMQDFLMLLQAAASGRDEWDRRLASRHLAPALPAVAEDIGRVLGGAFRKEFTALGLVDEYAGDLTRLRDLLTEFQEGHRPELKLLGSLDAPHNGSDGLALLDAIETVDPEAVVDLANEFVDVFRELEAVLGRLFSDAMLRPPEPATIGEEGC